jgi:hypothetical protein
MNPDWLGRASGHDQWQPQFLGLKQKIPDPTADDLFEEDDPFAVVVGGGAGQPDQFLQQPDLSAGEVAIVVPRIGEHLPGDA